MHTTAGSVKLRRGGGTSVEQRLRAVYAGQTDPPLGESAVVLPEVRFEPIADGRHKDVMA